MLFVFQFIAQNLVQNLAFAYPTNDEIIGQVEKTLLFDKDSRESVNFYKTDSDKKTSSVINKKSDSKESENNDLKVTLIEDNRSSDDLRQKEKMAYNYSLIGQYEVSIQLLKSVLQKEPNNSYSNFALASIYQKIGQNRQAKQIYFELLKTDIDNKEQVITNLLLIIAEQSPREAIATVKRLIAQSPDKDYLFDIAGQAYEKIGDLENSMQMFKKAYEINNDNPKYAYNLAVVCDKSKKYRLAFDYYDKSLDTSSDKKKEIPVEQIKLRIQQLRQLI